MRVASHPILCHDQVLLKFLQSDREWMDLDVNADGGKYVRSFEADDDYDNIEEIRHYSSELQVLVDLNIMSFCRLHFLKIV